MKRVDNTPRITYIESMKATNNNHKGKIK